MSHGPTIAGDRVVLRNLTPDDADAMAVIVGDDRVTHWMSMDSRDRAGTVRMIDASIASAAEEPRTEFYLAVCRFAGPATEGEAQEGDLVGFVRLAVRSAFTAQLGYAIGAEHWGAGYATDAARTMARYGFDVLGLHRITAAAGPENRRSIDVLTRLGFSPEGRMRHHVLANGAWRDSLLFSILDGELR